MTRNGYQHIVLEYYDIRSIPSMCAAWANPSPRPQPRLFYPYGMDYMFHGHGLLLGQSYLGRRLHDVLSALDLLVAAGAHRVRLYGRGQGALLALYAALLHDAIASTTLKNAPLSYQEWTHAPLVAWPATCFIPGVLAELPARLGQQSTLNTAVGARHAARTEPPAKGPTERTGADQDMSGQSLIAQMLWTPTPKPTYSAT